MNYLKRIHMLKIAFYWNILFLSFAELFYLLFTSYNYLISEIITKIFFSLLFIFAVKSVLGDIFELRRLENRYVRMNKDERIREEKKETSFETSVLYYKKYSKSYFIKRLSFLTLLLIIIVILFVTSDISTIEKCKFTSFYLMYVLSEVPFFLYYLESIKSKE
ncbi:MULTISPECIES: hypothetical protein [unclassified Lactococcus]|uniref:hypothetical protein n=1 Tax=unclassified Lactococcus TaxID=2643510 RepID=UPI0011CAC9A9|nr:MULTISPECIES: hypothetical protein [unclassified Lactococcus]MQW24079.1 hypothetical protein [Lactococcus sp. dk101]TXK36732.1 hypothetical protein FVP42_10830 [Lactococcus sp. dk310]TXK36739.1 hypothetical protein FVP42_10865 [Lactococcus sp. dk310]TXK46111.1 hypothetical protein FVP43_11105 [Lactococcus sp. dk322]